MPSHYTSPSLSPPQITIANETANALCIDIKSSLYNYDFGNPRTQSQSVRYAIIQLMHQASVGMKNVTQWYFDTQFLLKKISLGLKQEPIPSTNFIHIIDAIVNRLNVKHVNFELAQELNFISIDLIGQIEKMRYERLVEKLETAISERDTTCVFKENSQGILHEIKKQQNDPHFNIKYASLVLHTTYKLMLNPYDEKHRNELNQLIECAPPKTPNNNIKALLNLLLGTALMVTGVILSFVAFFGAAPMMMPLFAKGAVMATEAVGLTMMGVGIYGIFAKKAEKDLTSHMQSLTGIYKEKFPINALSVWKGY